MLTASAWKALAFILAAFALIYFYLRKVSDLVLGFGLLGLSPLAWLVNRQYLMLIIPTHPAKAFLPLRQSESRVKITHISEIELTDHDQGARTSYRFSLSGYHGAKFLELSGMYWNQLTFVGWVLLKARQGLWFSGIQADEYAELPHSLPHAAMQFESRLDGAAWYRMKLVQVSF